MKNFVRNSMANKGSEYGLEQQSILNDQNLILAQEEITRWPGYTVTPLLNLAGLANQLGVAELYYKDEGSRFGLGSFKALGGAYAVARLLSREIAVRDAIVPPSLAKIRAGHHIATTNAITVCCATDGNHGRSVAWGARNFGCQCVIFVHSTVSEQRCRAIEQYGARIIRTTGNYDDSIREAESTASREGWYVVSDTSYPGYTDVPTDVMQGYEVMASECEEQLDQPPTHIFLQTGVGGMAAAVAAYFKRRHDSERPYIILADPIKSACWLESMKMGKPTAVHGKLDTIMAGLACGEVSILAWSILQHHSDAVITVADDDAIDMMRRLANPICSDPAIVAGESAVAGLVALETATCNDGLRDKLNLDARSRVLVFGTESDTDPELYQNIVGISANNIRAKNS